MRKTGIVLALLLLAGAAGAGGHLVLDAETTEVKQGMYALTRPAIDSLTGLLVVGGYGIEIVDDAHVAELSTGIEIRGQHAVQDFWRIKMPCGRGVVYPLNALPEVDTPCPCGDPTHWIVKYEKED